MRVIGADNGIVGSGDIALIAIGFPKFKGGVGGYARYIAICPPDWKYGVSVGEIPEAPLPKMDKKLRWDEKEGARTCTPTTNLRS